MIAVDGKVIFVTGGTGLVGGHLVEMLVNRGASVVVLYRSLNPRSYFSTSRLGDKVVLVNGDVCDYSRVYDMVTKYEVDYVIHLAAQPIVPTAYDNPLGTITTNIIGTVNILESARRYRHIQGVIVASSDKAYGNLGKTYREDQDLRGSHPYDVSKSSADMIAQTYRKTYDMPVVITRFGNIYGPGDLHFTRIIPGIMRSVVTGEELLVRSNGRYQRDYIYVKDVALAYLFLLQYLDKTKGNAYNIATNDHYSVVELIKVSEKLLKTKISYRILNTARGETPEQHLDWAKIRRLGWKPIYTYESALAQTYDWYRTYAFI